MNKANIGVFFCECGGKIAGHLDLPLLIKQASSLPGVAFTGRIGYGCLPHNLEQMRQIIAERHLDRLVIAGCAGRSHGEHFRRALAQSIDQGLINLLNLRDLVARPHQDDPTGAILKARDQIAMAVAELVERRPSAPRSAAIFPQLVVIGGGLAGITAALALANADVPTVLLESQIELGGRPHLTSTDQETVKQAKKRIDAVRGQPHVKVLTDSRITHIKGPVGHYQVTLNNDQVLEAGAIIVAIDAQQDILTGLSLPSSQSQALRYAFVLCDLKPEAQSACRHACCLTSLRQAVEIKRQTTKAEVFIFFRELYTAGGMYNELVWEAQQLGVRFVRYPAGNRPASNDHKIKTRDELTGCEIQAAFDQVIIARPPEAPAENTLLAEMLRLPMDQAGFLAEPRVRLRPGDYLERGIYICGAAHFPCDNSRAEFEAYSAAARAAKYIKRKQMTSLAPAAHIDPARCNGCGDCVKVCPFRAVGLEPRPADPRALGKERPSLAVVDPLMCTACGNCVSVCPVKAAQVASTFDEQIEAQIQSALHKDHDSNPNDRVLIFACEWSGYSAAEIAGSQELSYPATTRIICLNCTGRLQPGLVLKALEAGAKGVLILGCTPGVCHFEQGNEHCLAVFEQTKALARLLSLDQRLKLEWVPADNGAQFVQVVKNFVSELDRC